MVSSVANVAEAAENLNSSSLMGRGRKYSRKFLGSRSSSSICRSSWLRRAVGAEHGVGKVWSATFGS